METWHNETFLSVDIDVDDVLSSGHVDVQLVVQLVLRYLLPRTASSEGLPPQGAVATLPAGVPRRANALAASAGPRTFSRTARVPGPAPEVLEQRNCL